MDEARYAWPGQYVDIEVQLAWEAWQEALNSTWVEPPSHQPIPERDHYPDRSKDDNQPGTD